ncbi:MAG: ankyrin repeat domain-containing protein, partial [Victivallaceae bacterium]|nr:ankyrin repeat domain-containing protein [Victivallaceae bacterium]
VAGGSNSPEILQLLLDRKMQVNQPMLHRVTPLHCAVRAMASSEVIGKFIRAGADVNAADAFGITVLQDAVSSDSAGTVGLLLAAGAKPRAADRRGLSALHYAAICNSVNVLELLVGAGADVNAPDRYGRTPLQFARLCGNEVVGERLLALGAKEPGKDQLHREGNQMYGANRVGLDSLVAPPRFSGEFPLPRKGKLQHCCVSERFTSAVALNHLNLVIPLLAERKVSGNTMNYCWHSALELALMEHVDLRIVKRLLDFGANPAIPFYNGWTPLMVATSEDNHVLARMLLDHGADPHQRSISGRITAYSLAQGAGNKKLLRLFDFYCQTGLKKSKNK